MSDAAFSTLPNQFTRRRSANEEVTAAQEFTDEEMLAIRVLCEDAVARMNLPSSTHDFGAHEFGKAVRGILAKMGQ